MRFVSLGCIAETNAEDSGRQGCSSLHSPSLHRTSVVSINSSVLHVASPCQNFLPKFLHLVDILTTDGVLLVALLDDGSDSCFLTFDAAERMGLRGKKEMSLIEIAGNKPVAKETQRFDLFIP